VNRTSFLAVVTLVAGPLGAQQPTPPPDHMMGDAMGMQQMMAPLMGVIAYTPQHLLVHKDALALTSDQVARLTQLRDATKTAHEAAWADAANHLRELRAAADAPTPDTAAWKIHFQAAHAAMGKAHWAMLASAAQAKMVLTEEQRGKVKMWADSMATWTQQHRRMMKPSDSH
jgi:Spy/CpxP family protein refolding chaperone